MTDTRTRYGIFWLVCAGVWLHAVDTLVTATLAPSIVDELSGVEYINWTIALYEVGAIIAGAASGALSLRFGLKRIFVSCSFLYALGCVGAAAAAGMPLLLSARLLQGFGGGMLLSLCYLAVQSWYPAQLRSRLYGIVAAVWGAGSLLGPLVGGLFAGPHTWRGAFWLFAAQALALGVLAWRYLPRDSRRLEKHERWPLRPLLLVSAATLVIAEAGVTRTAPAAAAGVLLGCLLLYAFARFDRRSGVRLLPDETLNPRHPVGAALLMVFALATGTTGFWAYGPLLVSILFGTRPLVTGFILAGEALAWSLATLAVGPWTLSHERGLIRAGALGVAAGASGFALAVPAGSLAGMILCGLLQGAGFGLCWPAIANRLCRSAATEEQSLAIAALSTVQRIGYAIGTASAGVAANFCGLADGISIGAAKAAGFWVFAAFIPVLLIGLSGAWTFTRERR